MAKLAVGAFQITPGHILAFLITVWASFLVSKFWTLSDRKRAIEVSINVTGEADLQGVADY
jgi:putative flippase GtrA